MASPTVSPLDLVRRFASRLRYPQLFLLTASLFAVDLVVPDLVPFVDEILLGLLTLLLGRLKSRRDEPGGGRKARPVVKDVTPPGPDRRA
ncbi:MAG TPA: DUF6116 family protein [Thermoanaerobaculia bacterium]|nr:DUF6116 family protein [Thermoanaerobaculia bacterium]